VDLPRCKTFWCKSSFRVLPAAKKVRAGSMKKISSNPPWSYQPRKINAAGFDS
jgi:hypothetical protein